MDRAVILLRNTDRNVRARQRFRAAANQLQTHIRAQEPGSVDVPVLAAYVVPATSEDLVLGQAVAWVIARGATQIVLVPYLVEWGSPEWLDVPDAIVDLAREYPDIRLKLAQPLGLAENMTGILAAQCTAAWNSPDMAEATVAQVVVQTGQPPVTPAIVRPGEIPGLPPHDYHLFMCFGRRCLQDGSDVNYRALMAILAEKGMETKPSIHGLIGRTHATDGDDAGNGLPRVKVTRTKCMGPCAGSPTACVYPSGEFYWNLNTEIMPQFVEEVLVNGRTLPGHTFIAGELTPAETAAPAGQAR